MTEMNITEMIREGYRNPAISQENHCQFNGKNAYYHKIIIIIVVVVVVIHIIIDAMCAKAVAERKPENKRQSVFPLVQSYRHSGYTSSEGFFILFLYIAHKKPPHKTLRVHSAGYTQCIHVSSRKLKLPKDTHTKKYKQLLPTHPFPKVELHIAVKRKNIYRVTNNDNRKKNRAHTHARARTHARTHSHTHNCCTVSTDTTRTISTMLTYLHAQKRMEECMCVWVIGV